MKQWTVYYRDKNGSKASVVIEAEDRAGVFAELKKRGISAISVSEGASNKKPRKVVGGGASSKGRVFIAAAVAVLIAGVAVWLMWPEAEKPVEVKKAVKKSVKVEPVRPVKEKPVAKAEEAVEKKISKEDLRLSQLKQIREKYGDNIPDNLKPTVHFLENPPKMSFHPARSRVNIFKHRSDRKIASMLLVKPGAWMIRPPKFDANFDKEFIRSLQEPIEITTDDSDEDRELKIAVQEIRGELLKHKELGEAPSAVMQKEVDALVRLGNYKKDLYSELLKIKKDASYSDADVVDFVTAANKMLEKEGLSGFKIPKLLTRQLFLQRKQKD